MRKVVRAATMALMCTIPALLVIAYAYAVVGSTAAATVDRPGLSLRVKPGPDPATRLKLIMGMRGRESEGFRLDALLVTAVVAPGQRISLRLTLWNVTDAILHFGEGSPEHDFALIVENDQGKQLSPTKDTSFGSALYRDIQPGESLEYLYHVDRMYDLSAIGRYRITASMRVPRLDGEGWTDVVADTVVLTVSEQPQTGGPSAAIPATERRATASTKPPVARVEPRMLAVRPVLEDHGFNVVWRDKEKTLVATSGDVTATFRAGSNLLVVDDQNINMGRPARLVKGRLEAPVHAISLVTKLPASRAWRERQR